VARKRGARTGADGGGWQWWMWWVSWKLPSGKHTKNYGKSPFSMGKSTISMVIFNSYVKLPEGRTVKIVK
jgi:hypothetical protein